MMRLQAQHSMVDLETALMEINHELQNVESLDPVQISKKIEFLIGTGLETNVVQMIALSLQFYHEHKLLIRYIRVIDRLLKTSVFNQLLQNFLVELYCEAFKFLLQQRAYNQLDEMKLLRKMWLKSVHPRVLMEIKEVILTHFHVDVDRGFKSRDISLIKAHYIQKLKLGAEELAAHLPNDIKKSNEIYSFDTPTPPVPHQPDPYMIETPQNHQIHPYVLEPSGNHFIRLEGNAFENQPSHQHSNPQVLPPIHHSNLQTAFQNQGHFNRPLNFLEHNHQQPNHQLFDINSHNINRQTFSMPNYSEHNVRAQKQRLSESYLSRGPNSQPPSQKYPDSLPSNFEPHQTISRFKSPSYSSEQTQSSFPAFQGQAQFQGPFSNGHRNSAERALNHGNGRDSFKRQRLFSQEFRNIDQLQSTSYTEGVYPIPQKKVHQTDFQTRNPNSMIENKFLSHSFPESSNLPQLKTAPFMNILNALRKQSLYHCKECGCSFKKREIYEDHITQHFQGKAGFEPKKRMHLLNRQDWSMSRSQSGVQFNQFYISLSNISNEQAVQYRCRLCNEPFELLFKENTWVLNMATFCDVEGRKLPMHKSCQEELQDSGDSVSD